MNHDFYKQAQRIEKYIHLSLPQTRLALNHRFRFHAQNEQTGCEFFTEKFTVDVEKLQGRTHTTKFPNIFRYIRINKIHDKFSKFVFLFLLNIYRF